MLGPVWLYEGRKYIGIDVEICYDGPDRPFSIESYGPCLFANSDVAYAEAGRLANFLNSKLSYTSGLAYAIRSTVDRHTVAVMLRADWLVDKFGDVPGNRPLDLFKRYLESLFSGFAAIAPALHEVTYTAQFLTRLNLPIGAEPTAEALFDRLLPLFGTAYVPGTFQLDSVEQVSARKVDSC
jgi:hypothetical protein